MRKMGDILTSMKKRFFVGRQRELDALMKHLEEPAETERIIGLHGIGGIGKSTLLDEFRRLAAERRADVLFVSVDSRDMPHTPSALLERLAALAGMDALAEAGSGRRNESGAEGEGAGEGIGTRLDVMWEPVLERFGNSLNGRQTVICIDTYEELTELDWWIREHLIPALPADTLVVLAGRKPLGGEWISSPVWQALVRNMGLTPFGLQECREYAGVVGAAAVKADEEALFRLSQGHPLTLCLIAPFVSGGGAEGLGGGGGGLAEALPVIASRWLRELPDSKLQLLLDGAAVVRVFDQDLLESILGEPVVASQFGALTSLSFVRPGRRGWAVHDLLRAALMQDMASRAPETYSRLRLGAMQALLRRLDDAAAVAERSALAGELFYVYGDTHIRSTYLDGGGDQGEYREEPVRLGNAWEAEAYVEGVIRSGEDLRDMFHDPVTQERHELVRLWAADEKLFGHLHISEMLNRGQAHMSLYKNGGGETAGLLIILPMYEETMEYLSELPVTRRYMALLSSEERQALRVPREACEGWFIYHVDLRGDNSPGARAAAFRGLLARIILGGLFVFSTPIAYMQMSFKRLGFTELAGSVHEDFGAEYPTPVMALDLRGGRHALWLRQLMMAAGGAGADGGGGLGERTPAAAAPGAAAQAEAAVPAGPQQEAAVRFPAEWGLTAREREVAELALACKSVKEIAAKLYVTPVTVKKHLGRIYEKLGIHTRTELVRKLTEARMLG